MPAGEQAGLLRLDVRLPDHLAPFLGFIGDELSEIGRCSYKRRGTYKSVHK